MNKPIYVDTSHLTEAQKCILALEQAFALDHSEYRIHELRERLMKLSIVALDDKFDVKDIEVEWD